MESVSVQKGPDLYSGPASDEVEPGIHSATVKEWRMYRNDFGDRRVLSLALGDGRIVETSFPLRATRTGKLWRVLCGALGREPSLHELDNPAKAMPLGLSCRVVTGTFYDMRGRPYARIETVLNKINK